MNIALRFSDMAKKFPEKKAVLFSKKKDAFLTFRQVENLSNQYAHFLRAHGFKRGMKTLLFVRPSLRFHALVWAIFKMGMVPILIDPGMGKKNLLRAIEEVSPEGLIAEPEVHLLSLFFRETFSSVTTKLSSLSFNLKLKDSPSYFETESLEPDEMAALLYTSGGTGRPKGVVYTHRIFDEQTRLLQEMFSLNEKETDLAGFPLFSLFTLSMGMTSCIPDMDPSRPAKADPKKLVQNIQDSQASFVAGSPAIWGKVARYCLEKKITLPTVKYLVMFGAPVRTELHEAFEKILPNGTTYTPYGATESLPVSNISGATILKETASLTKKGQGTCIGLPVSGIEVAVIKTADEALSELPSKLSSYEVGEIIVKGPVVTKSYYKALEETRQAKIPDGEGFWHRIGDVGYFDEKGRLWFCGRKSHRVETKAKTFYSIQVEALYNNHPSVSRSALIGLKKEGETFPAIVIELKDKTSSKEKLIEELKAISPEIQHFFFNDSFPVDVRHNIKIDRLLLAKIYQEGL